MLGKAANQQRLEASKQVVVGTAPGEELPVVEAVGVRAQQLQLRDESSRCTEDQRLRPSPTYADTPLPRAMPMRAGTKARSPSPCTDGGRRTTEARTSCAASACTASSEGMRGAEGALASGASSSVASRPGVRTVIPEVITKGRPDPVSAAPSASMARRSVSPAVA